MQPGRIRYCKNEWHPDPVVPSSVNGGASGVRYTFYFNLDTSLDDTDGTLYVELPVVFSVNQAVTTVLTGSIEEIKDAESNVLCYKSTLSSTLTNPAAYSSAGPFSLWTQSSYGTVRDVNWGFASVGFGPKKIDF